MALSGRKAGNQAVMMMARDTSKWAFNAAVSVESGNLCGNLAKLEPSVSCRRVYSSTMTWLLNGN